MKINIRFLDLAIYDLLYFILQIDRCYIVIHNEKIRFYLNISFTIFYVFITCLSSIDCIGHGHELLGRDGFQRPPATKSVERSRSAFRNLDPVLKPNYFPPAVNARALSTSIRIRSRKQLLYAILTRMEHISSQ